ncbi:MAG: sulfite exporter TauE/SafE family protein [Planctomycetes bacterium]|nr:sulfite exporter TauE/SafE family protein [Planctomycetota bacterium]
MPELFPDTITLVACALIMAVAQLIYATVGFGAGMFAVALLALVLPDLAAAVTILLLLTFVTEVWVLAHEWRRARARLLLGLVPAMIVGLWIGTQILVAGDVAALKRLLGLVVAGAGVWFLLIQRQTSADQPNAGENRPANGEDNAGRRRGFAAWISVPIGLVSGLLGGMFGTGGPPVIIFLRAYRLDKGAFRATLLWYFFLMSLVRGCTYFRAGLLTRETCLAALWLLPASLAGILAGMAIHRRTSERGFATAVSILLVVLGVLLVAGLQR